MPGSQDPDRYLFIDAKSMAVSRLIKNHWIEFNMLAADEFQRLINRRIGKPDKFPRLKDLEPGFREINPGGEKDE